MVDIVFDGSVTASSGINLGDETLSDYDEGSWTPTVSDASSGGNLAGGTKFGRYTRIGNLVTVFFESSALITSGMTAGNPVYIQGLPFTVSNDSNNNPIGTPCYTNNVDFAGTITSWAVRNSTYARFVDSQTGAGTANTIVSDITSGSAGISFVAQYRI